MTPKEKALDLTSKYWKLFKDELENTIAMSEAKACALLAVDEIDAAIDFDWMEVQNLDREHAYWQKVKVEINNL